MLGREEHRDNIKMELEETGLEVSTGYEYGLKQDSIGSLRCHSNNPLNFVGGGVQLLMGVLSISCCRWIVVSEPISKTV
jgi:hypothetical protein